MNHRTKICVKNEIEKLKRITWLMSQKSELAVNGIIYADNRRIFMDPDNFGYGRIRSFANGVYKCEMIFSPHLMKRQVTLWLCPSKLSVVPKFKLANKFKETLSSIKNLMEK